MLCCFAFFRFYTHQRHTSNLQVQYYTKDGFAQTYHGRALTNLEREIENLYIQNLRQECYKEQMTSKSRLTRYLHPYIGRLKNVDNYVKISLWFCPAYLCTSVDDN